jgi:creatinine amidohydrolase
MTEVMWSRLTVAELNALAKAGATVILPVASTEQHGPHLATGVDTTLCGEVTRRTAVKLAGAGKPVVVGPMLWLGLAEHHVAMGGTFTVGIATYHAILRDMVRSVTLAGFRRIVIVNGHGGNITALNVLTEELTREFAVPVASTTYWLLPEQAGDFKAILQDQPGVQHACEAETSMMLAVAPDMVRKERIAEAVDPTYVSGGPSPLSAPLFRWRSFKDFTTNGVRGDARRSNADKGERLLEAAASRLAAALIDGQPWV